MQALSPTPGPQIRHSGAQHSRLKVQVSFCCLNLKGHLELEKPSRPPPHPAGCRTLAKSCSSSVCPQPLLSKKLHFLGSLEEKVNC